MLAKLYRKAGGHRALAALGVLTMGTAANAQDIDELLLDYPLTIINDCTVECGFPEFANEQEAVEYLRARFANDGHGGAPTGAGGSPEGADGPAGIGLGLGLGPVLLLWLKQGLQPGREEHKPITTLAKVAFAFVALFGITGGSVVAASTNSLPDSWLYDVKLATEDVRITLSDGEAGTAQLYLDLADERLEEMERLVAKGSQPDYAVLERLRTQLRESTRAAAGAPAEEIPGLLLQLRSQGALPTPWLLVPWARIGESHAVHWCGQPFGRTRWSGCCCPCSIALIIAGGSSYFHS